MQDYTSGDIARTVFGRVQPDGARLQFVTGTQYSRRACANEGSAGLREGAYPPLGAEMALQIASEGLGECTERDFQRRSQNSPLSATERRLLFTTKRFHTVCTNYANRCDAPNKQIPCEEYRTADELAHR